jgi:enamine deaminase RidA (YjgF/YER057c/UK114 family)
MIIQRKWSSLVSIGTFNVIVGFGCSNDPPGACALAFSTALDECARSGLANSQVARSRIWARDANLRKIASDARLEALDGELRAASASFIAPERMPDGIDVLVDLVAISDNRPKQVREYEPRIAPPMSVTIGDIVFLSGNTDVSETFDQQLENICANISKSLKVADVTGEDIVQIDAYVAARLGVAYVYKQIVKCFPCAISITTVEGYSAPEKLVEIEVTASRNSIREPKP